MQIFVITLFFTIGGIHVLQRDYYFMMFTPVFGD